MTALEAATPLRVLLIEDSIDDAELILRMLRALDPGIVHRRVDRESDLRSALTEAAWDLVISDYVLPGFSGLAAIAVVRELRPELPVIIVSGTVGEDIAVDAVRSGAHDYVMKSNLYRLPYAAERALRDVDGRRIRAAEQAALIAAERRFDGVLDAVPTAIVVVDAEGIIVRANAHCLAVFGYLPEALIGAPVDQLVDADDRPTHAAMREHFLRDPVTRQMGHGREVQALRRDGTRIPVDIGLAIIQSELETLIVVAANDITERIALEARVDAAARMEALGRFAGGVAHDFNNLLTAINGFAELLATELPADSALAGDVAEIRAAGERGAELVRRLLAFGRRQSLKPEPTDLDEVFEGLHPLLLRLVTESIDIKIHVAPGTPLILTDRSALEQAIVNLVVNAQDAMPGGGTLSITVDTVATAGAPDVRVVVADTGIGIREEVLAHLFTPFFTTKAPGQGTGLGLASVHGFVTQSGGTIAAGASPSGGATFTIQLPSTDAAINDRGAATATAPTPEPGHGRLVMVVEDDATVRALVQVILERHGYEVLAVGRPDLVGPAIGSAHRSPSVLVTDVVMPGGDGRTLARDLRIGHPDIGVVLMSGYAPDARDGAGQDPNPLEGLDRAVFVAKPFVAEQLIVAVAQALSLVNTKA